MCISVPPRSWRLQIRETGLPKNICHYEIGDQNSHFYVCVSGPTEVQSHWFKNLAPECGSRRYTGAGGHLAELSAERTDLVKEGIACYRKIRGDIRKALPFLPLDVSDNEDLWVCGGLQLENKAYLAVWKREMEGKNNIRRRNTGTVCTETTLSIPLGSLPFAAQGL